MSTRTPIAAPSGTVVRLASWDDPTPIPRGKPSTRPPDKRRRFPDDTKPRKTSGASSTKES